MPSSGRSRRDRDEELEDEDERLDDDVDEEDDEEESATRRRSRSRPRRSSRHTSQRAPVRRWRSSDEDEEEEGDESGPASAGPTWKKKPIYWRARDSLFFEPLVALAIIVILLVSLYAYTQNWPPVYVVESQSMQHGPADQLGLINAGDLVLAQKIPTTSITPYVSGYQTGYTTYGEFGDVILYWANGQSGSGVTPIIHRAILYLQWDAQGSFYNATDLLGLPCGNPATQLYATPGTLASSSTAANCGVTRLTGDLDLYHIGWRSLNLTIPLLSPALGHHSGFLTLGDNNTEVDQAGVSTPVISQLVEPGWILGVARGMIPWFGAVKLLLEGNAGRVPPQSWEFLGLTLVAAILVAFGVHWAFRTEGIETPLRRREEEAERERVEAEPPVESLPRRFLNRLRRQPSDEDEEEEAAEEKKQRRSRPPPAHTSTRRGRPSPRVRRAQHATKKSDTSDEL